MTTHRNWGLLLPATAMVSLSAGCADTPDGFPAEFAKAVCAKAYSCCPVDELVSQAVSFGRSEDECRVEVTRNVVGTFEPLKKRLSQGRMSWSATAASLCLAQIEQAQCGDFATMPRQLPASCHSLWVPSVKIGDKCCSSSECIDGYCYYPSCDPYENAPGACYPLVQAGGACRGRMSCAAGLYCRTSPILQCTPLEPDGAACQSSGECLSEGCELGPGPDGGSLRVCGSPPVPQVCSAPSPVL
jgi:hypothetical protein